MRNVYTSTISIALLILCLIGFGCSKKEDLPKCTESLKFTQSAVPLTKVEFISPIGIMAPVGGSPLPKGHTGYMLNEEDVSVSSPGSIKIYNIRSTTYLSSPTRPGYTDYSIYYNVCKGLKGHFGHLSELTTSIQSKYNPAANCSEYSTVDEDILSCEQNVKINLSAGDPIGKAGTQPHSPALDMGMLSSEVENYIAPSRYPDPGWGFICPSDWYTEPLKSEMNLLVGSFSGPSANENPKCGSMSIDVEDTAQGRWTLQSSPGNGNDPQDGDFFVLAPNPYAPESEVVISTRISELDTSSLPEFNVILSGRVNVPPTNIALNSEIFCYSTNLGTSTFSYFVRLSSSNILRVEKIEHAAGASPCSNSPGTWAFGVSAVDLIR